MKHNIIISISLLAVLTGCTKNEVLVNEQHKKKICFNEPVVSALSRATGEIAGQYPTDESFAVFSVYHQSAFTGWTATGTTNYINRAEFTYDAALDDTDSDVLGGWSGGYFFPKTGYLSFSAYSPFRAHSTIPGDGTGTFEYGNYGLTITDFTIPVSPANHFDLMFSERIYNRQSSTGIGDGYEGMDLTFHHALSSIRFKVQKKEAYPGHDFKLLGIKICNVESKGDFQENITNETTSTYSSTPAWTLDGVINDYGIDTDELPITLYGTNNYHEVTQGLILMPQIFKEGSTIVNGDAAMVIDYQVTVSSIPVEQTATVKLNTVTDRWEMGKRYIYNITLGYDTITVSPTVPGWVDVNVDAAIK